ncbi:MAG TPA: hypothetical protein VMT53_22430 [Terriglobales bacterium]|nr:hypothetical protein [Terriglobales bacterium]
MRNFSSLHILLMFALTLPYVKAQSSNDELHANQSPTGASGAPPAMGEEPAPPQSSQFPPLSGLDEPSLEPNVAARSFLTYGAQASEIADSNAANSLNGKRPAITGVTHLLGSAGLQRLWERYQLGLDYVGGGAFYAGRVRDNAQMHELKFDARTAWRTGALTLRDTASYLPDGTFVGSFSGAGSGAGIGNTGAGGLGGATGERFTFFGANGFGSLGAYPRLINLSVLDLQQALSPRSAFTLAGGYNYIHFTQATGGLLIDSREASAQAGFDHSFDRRNKMALIYGFQHFQFPTASGLSFVTHVGQLLYGHQITGRMDLLVGAGPQFTRLSSPAAGSTLKVSVSARVSLRYKFPRTSLRISYDRFNSVASGFFAGALTDRVRFSVHRPIQRHWLASVEVGYNHQKRLQIADVGVNAASYQAGFAGFRMSRTLSRSLSGFFFYEFNDLAIDRSFCAGGGACDRTSIRHIVGAGLLWHPRAIRLD